MKHFYQNIFKPVTQTATHDADNISLSGTFGTFNSSAASIQEEAPPAGAIAGGDGACVQ